MRRFVKSEPSGKFVCAVTPHLFWDPAKPAVKLLQAKFLLDWVRDYQVKWRRDRKAADQGDVGSCFSLAFYSGLILITI
jgi:mRNA deadenylase 3'-5' endonuclease subunit Ccr4